MENLKEIYFPTKSVLLSMRSKWVDKVLSGKKTIEVRKSRPKIYTPFKCFIYCTKSKNKNDDLWSDARVEEIVINGEKHCDYVADSIYYLNGSIVGEFVCNFVTHSNEHLFDENKITMQKLMKSSCMTFDEINNYRHGKDIFAWHISDLKIYDEPKELSTFGLKRPPQSWCYVDRLEE